MTATEINSAKVNILDLIASGVTVIGEGISAGPFKNSKEMRDKFEELGVTEYDEVGEKTDKVLK